MDVFRPVTGVWHRSWEDDKPRVLYGLNSHSYYRTNDQHIWQNWEGTQVMSLDHGGHLNVADGIDCIGTCYVQGELYADSWRPVTDRWIQSAFDSVNRLYFGRASHTCFGTCDAFYWQNSSQANIMWLHSNGHLVVTGDITGFASDARLKKNVRVIENALEKLRRVRGVTFEWDETTPQPMRGADCGLIAQDVAAVLPEGVKPAPFDPEYLTIASGNRVLALVIEALKELDRRVAEIGHRVVVGHREWRLAGR